MDGSGYTEFQRIALEQWASGISPGFRSRKDSSTLVLDQFGRILSCSPSAEQIFGISQVGMLGRLISEFVKGLFLAGSSPSYSARYLVHLCAGGDWRRFEARAASGQTFPIEVNIARMASINTVRDMYLLDVRPAVAARTS
jgi:PAS domain S-box-containing protein